MPWKTECVQDQRWRFLKWWRSGKMTVAGLCRRIGISRKTAYKWIARFELEGRRGLHDQARRAQVIHNRPGSLWLKRIRHARARHPTWGTRKLRAILIQRHGPHDVPSVAAIGRWLRVWRLTQRRRRRGAKRGPLLDRPHLTVALRPNDVWSVDFKGWFRTADGTRVDPLTVRDMASRCILAIELLRDQSVERTQAQFVRVFTAHGLPRAIRVDNGCPFGADGALGLTRLSAWWIKLGIRVEFITPGCPGENAGHEQMHGVYKAEVANPPAPTLRAQKQRTKHWVRCYNDLRPHESLAMLCPAQLYEKSARPMPSVVGPFRYPSAWLTRLVKGKGMISLDGRGRFVGEAFERERVGLKRTPVGWDVYFGHLLIGTLHADENTGIHAVQYRRKPKQGAGACGPLHPRQVL
jgi:putative transposase